MSIDVNVVDVPPGFFVAGWEPNPEAVAEIASIQPIGEFADTPAGAWDAPLVDYVNLDDAAEKVLGHVLPTRNQGNAGTCVAFGTVAAIEYCLLVAIAGGAPYEFPELGISTEVIYGLSRVEIGGGRLGRGDGSIGAWAAQAAKQYGFVARKNYSEFDIDLSKYSIPISRDWGRYGVPDKFEPTVKQHPVKSIALARTIEDLVRALMQGYAIAESSSYLLRDSRDANGIIGMYRGGGHCMAVTGAIKINGVYYFFIRNSWGDGAHVGPTHPRFKSKAGGLVHQDYLTAILKQGDTWIFGGAEGFPVVNKPSWYI